MTPEQLQIFEDMQKRIDDLENVKNNNTIQLTVDTLVKRVTTVTDTDIDRMITVGIGGGTFDVLDYPDMWLVFKYKGKLYRMGAYEEERFN